MSGALIRRRLRLCGAVQGVGLRWRARHAARAVGATGWVQNLSDGSVLMELQGREEQIDRVLQSLEESRYIAITDMDVRRVPVLPDERDFVARDDTNEQ